MKAVWKNILSIIVMAVVAVVFTKLFWPTEKEIDIRLDEIKKTKAIVDSLKTVNTRLSAKVDSLQNAGQARLQEIDNLKDRIQKQRQSLQAALEALYEYKGTDGDLVRELNQLIKSPLPTLPD